MIYGYDSETAHVHTYARTNAPTEYGQCFFCFFLLKVRQGARITCSLEVNNSVIAPSQTFVSSDSSLVCKSKDENDGLL